MDVFDNCDDLGVLYPDRTVFHVFEVVSFHITLLRFAGEVGDLILAGKMYVILKEIGPAPHIMEQAEMFLKKAQLKKSYNNQITGTTIDQPKTVKTEFPAFENEVIKKLYTENLFHSPETIDAILDLKHESLVSDLRTVLLDSIDRYSYFDAWEIGDDFESNFQFVVHVFFLAGEIEATELLPDLFYSLSQSHDYVDMFFGDFLADDCWEPICKLIKNDITPTLDFVKKPGVDTNSKTAVCEAVSQLALNYPERRPEVLNWFRSVLEFYNSCKISDNVIDSSLNGFIAAMLMALNAKELIKDMKPLYDRDLVNLLDCGTYDEFQAALQSKEKIELFDTEKYWACALDIWIFDFQQTHN